MDALSLFVDGVYRQVVAFAVAVFALGLLVMAIIQSVKDLLPVRRWFHRSFIRAWLAHKARDHMQNGGAQVSPDAALTDLIALATTGDAHALFDLPAEQLAAQVAAAASESLDFPTRHDALLRCLTASADPHDVDLVMTAETGASHAPTDPAIVDARTRLLHHTQRSVDALQIAAGYRWKWYMQLSSFALASAIAVLAMATDGVDSSRTSAALYALPLGLAGGFVAPVARDFIAAWTRRG